MLNSGDVSDSDDDYGDNDNDNDNSTSKSGVVVPVDDSTLKSGVDDNKFANEIGLVPTSPLIDLI